jgi:hypothetical protein
MRFVSAVIVSCAAVLSCAAPLLANELQFKNSVETFVKVVGSNDRGAIAAVVSYPLRRNVPLPTIKNASQLLDVFEEVFDEALLKAISTSSLADHWAEMGWRGSMYQNGAVWLDGDGKITAINYQTEKGRLTRELLINADKRKLHASLQNFLEPVLEWETKDYRIRIDSLIGEKFRYAVWPLQKRSGETPDLVVMNGEVVFEGSGGNHNYEFKSGIYSYRCIVNLLGASDLPPGELEVYKKNKVVLRQPVVTVITGR